MPWGKDEDWMPPERYAGERPDLEAEARRLVALTREAQTRRETLERQVRSRLAGYRPADQVIERADAARANGNGNGNGLPYPREWTELADLARELARPDRKRARPGRLPDEE